MKQLKMPLVSAAAECFVLGNHDPNPPVQECCPTLGQKAMADWAKIISLLTNSQTLLIQIEGGRNGTKIKIWKKVPPSCAKQRARLKKIEAFTFLIVCLILNTNTHCTGISTVFCLLECDDHIIKPVLLLFPACCNEGVGTELCLVSTAHLEP